MCVPDGLTPLFSQVLRALDKDTGALVAVKMVDTQLEEGSGRGGGGDDSTMKPALGTNLETVRLISSAALRRCL